MHNISLRIFALFWAPDRIRYSCTDSGEPRMNEHLTRREMLKRVGIMIGLTASGLPVIAHSQARPQGLAAVGNALVSLTPAEAETLRAIIARIIPADENGPGALEARADRFIDRALGGTLKNLRPVYGAGLAAVNSRSEERRVGE